ncbi:MAG: dihydropteroate synthase [Thermoanaerobaculia bacterium]
MILELSRGRALQFGRAPLVMGILNVTPDSFSDGGVHFDQSKAVHSALQMESDGAAVVDIGGESTRPGSDAVSAADEIERVVPVIQQIRRRSDLPISIDTRKADVAAAALDAGADIINDVSALRHDPKMTALASSRRAPVILMHMRGEPRTMQQFAQYDDVVRDVASELRERIEAAVNGGIARESILIDPGIGFAKTADHNIEILARCAELGSVAPFVIGASRKAFIGHLTGKQAGPERMVGSLAAVAAAVRGGAAIVRVHDIGDTVDFLRVLMAIEGKRR